MDLELLPTEVMIEEETSYSALPYATSVNLSVHQNNLPPGSPDQVEELKSSPRKRRIWLISGLAQVNSDLDNCPAG